MALVDSPGTAWEDRLSELKCYRTCTGTQCSVDQVESKVLNWVSQHRLEETV
jgi:hypothetical protein